MRHVKIRDDDVNASSKVEIEGLHSIRCDIDLVTQPLDDVFQDDPIGLFVFDDEYACHDIEPLLRAAGGRRLAEYAVTKRCDGDARSASVLLGASAGCRSLYVKRVGGRRFAAKKRRKPERALTTLRQAVADALVIKGARGEATGVAETLLGRLAEQAGRAS